MEKNPNIAGKIALVTGASRGIGRAISQRLASAGATVVVTARSVEKAAVGSRFQSETVIPGTLAETVALITTAGGKAIALGADLERPEERDSLISRAVAETGGLDILVNNAGFADYARVESMPMCVVRTFGTDAGDFLGRRCLFFSGGRDGRRNLIDLRDAVEDALDGFNRGPGCGLDAGDLTSDLFCGFGGLRGEALHLASDDREALARFTRAPLRWSRSEPGGWSGRQCR